MALGKPRSRPGLHFPYLEAALLITEKVLLLPASAMLLILLMFVGFTVIKQDQEFFSLCRKEFTLPFRSIYEVSVTLFRISVFNVSPSHQHLFFHIFDLVSELPCPIVVDPEFNLKFFILFCFPFLALGTKISILPIQPHHIDIKVKCLAQPECSPCSKL